jgi:hypothetical protein
MPRADSTQNSQMPPLNENTPDKAPAYARPSQSGRVADSAEQRTNRVGIPPQPIMTQANRPLQPPPTKEKCMRANITLNMNGLTAPTEGHLPRKMVTCQPDAEQIQNRRPRPARDTPRPRNCG